jgi:Tol biopolymer transport system component
MISRPRSGAIAALLLLAALPLGSGEAALTTRTTRVSVRSDGSERSGDSYIWKHSLSTDARYVAFESIAKLVAKDTNPGYDVYLKDRVTGKTSLMSVMSSGSQPPGTWDSIASETSADGRYVVFESAAPLVPGDVNGGNDVYLHDRLSKKTRMMNVRSNGSRPSNGTSFEASISPNGRYIAFTSDSTDLVTGDGNSQQDIFLHDRTTSKTRRVSVSSNGTETDGSSERPSVADTGVVAFSSFATTLVPGDGNGVEDVFVHDSSNRKTHRVSVTSGGGEGSGQSHEVSISRSGDTVSFKSVSQLSPKDGDTSSDVYVHVSSTGKTLLMSLKSNGTHVSGTSASYTGSLSHSGRYVVFTTDVPLVAGDGNGTYDIYRHDRKTGKTILASVGHGGAGADQNIYEGVISGNGRFVAFDTPATNMVAHDTNASPDVFIRGPLP